MPGVLLRPHLLAAKNRILHETRGQLFGRDALVAIISIFMIAAIYFGTYSFLIKIRSHPQYLPLLPARLMSISLFAFFVLLLFSNTISALGYLFCAKDLPLLLTLPVSHVRLYFARLCEIIATSSWMFILFGAPAVVGFYKALDLPWTFMLTSIALLIPFVLIPAALSTILVTLFVNIIPPYRIRDLLVIAAFLLVCLILYLNHGNTAHISTEHTKLDDMIGFLHTVKDPHPLWFPSRWVTEIVNSFIVEGAGSVAAPALLLISSTAVLTILGFLIFDNLFLRGWSLSAHASRNLRVRGFHLIAILGRAIIPFNSQLRALCYKEAKMFLRDTTQSLQLLMLLMLTFVYLYNFRALRSGSDSYQETIAWWQVVLSLANMVFGACVVAAISTRFVFPSISLEGRAFLIVRAAPLTIEQLLRNKFYTWLGPTCGLSVLLLVSGSWAIYGSFETVVATAIVSVALGIGISGLGVGIGAVYAKFDWDSPSQVTASFGSLVYMLLAMGLVMITMIPSLLMFVLTCVPNFVAQMSRNDYLLVLCCSYFLIFFINYMAARQALSAGAHRLRDLEK